MSDIVFSLCGKIEKSYRKGSKIHLLSARENELMLKYKKEVISMLRDFDGISCIYDESKSVIIFKR